MHCNSCKHYQPTRVEWEGEISFPKMCQAGPDDTCPAEAARQRDLSEVVVPCPHCGRDCDGHGVCPSCGEIIGDEEER